MENAFSQLFRGPYGFSAPVWHPEKTDSTFNRHLLTCSSSTGVHVLFDQSNLQEQQVVVICAWRVNSDLFPVGSDDAYVTGRDGSQALLALCRQQFLHIVHQHLHLRYVEKRRTAGLTLINTGHTMEDHWEVLREMLYLRNVIYTHIYNFKECLVYAVLLWGGRNLRWGKHNTVSQRSVSCSCRIDLLNVSVCFNTDFLKDETEINRTFLCQ